MKPFPMPPLQLSDAELDAVMHACRPLLPERRNAFLQALASELRHCGEVGPGSTYRAIRSVQRQFFDPPDIGHNHGAMHNNKFRKRDAEVM
jgi:hypothetical protein